MVYLFAGSEDGERRAALNDFLKSLLAQGVVEAVYTPLRTAHGDGVAPALVHDPARLDQADPLAPVMLVNGARVVAGLTLGGSGRRIAAVLRPCEIRALIELAKLKQASLDQVMIIGMDCAGTYEPADYWRALRAGDDPASGGMPLRAACRMCEYPAPPFAEITIGHIGIDGLLVEMEAETAEKMGIAPHPNPLPGGERGQGGAEHGAAIAPHPNPLPGGERGQIDGGVTGSAPSPLQGEGWGEGGSAALAARRQRAIDELVRERTARLGQETTAIVAQLRSADALAAYFATCQRCHNCMTACPICYCKECLFRTAAFEHAPEHCLRTAGRKGALRLPADTLLFHLTRMNHMSTSCVGCGMCESACPSDIPLTTLFRAVATRTQALFDYVPGRRLDEDLPLTTFREAELEGV